MSAPPPGRRWLTDEEQEVYRLRTIDELPWLMRLFGVMAAYNYERARVWIKSRGKIWWKPA